MDILIKDMEMPKNCHDCKNGWCNLWEKNKNMTIGRHPDCPLVALPEHGDLIDRQAVLSYFETAFLMGADMDYEDIVGIVSNPKAIATIVEANNGTDN